MYIYTYVCMFMYHLRKKNDPLTSYWVASNSIVHRMNVFSISMIDNMVVNVVEGYVALYHLVYDC